jgi:hypothetical protein
VASNENWPQIEMQILKDPTSEWSRQAINQVVQNGYFEFIIAKSLKTLSLFPYAENRKLWDTFVQKMCEQTPNKLSLPQLAQVCATLTDVGYTGRKGW